MGFQALVGAFNTFEMWVQRAPTRFLLTFQGRLLRPDSFRGRK